MKIGILFLLFSLSQAQAEENCDEISGRPIEIHKHSGLELISNIFHQSYRICIKPDVLKESFAASVAFKRLRSEEPEAFLTPECFQTSQLKNPSNEDVKLLLVALVGKGQPLVIGMSKDRPEQLVISPEKENFKSDQLINPGVTMEPVIGVIANSEYYKVKKVKTLAAFSSPDSSASYYLKDTELNSVEKENLIKFTTPVVGLMLGYLKEAYFDDKTTMNNTGRNVVPRTIKIEFKFN